MPTLTDQKDRDDDYQPPTNLDEPPEYAMRYIFNTNRNPHSEWEGAARLMALAGAATNLIAAFVLVANLELILTLSLWVFLGVMLVVCGWGGREVWQLHRKRAWITFLPLLLIICGVGLELSSLHPFTEVFYVLHWLPGSLFLAASGLILAIVTSNK
jgi:hypothetical protein